MTELPAWLQPVAQMAATARVEDLSRHLPPEGEGRNSAVLLLFGHDGTPYGGPDVLLIERARTLRDHAGQPAFPGGAVDPDDPHEIGTALRETQEETSADPAGITVFGTLPTLWLPPSGFRVTPVLGWWHAPTPVGPVDPGEVAAVHRVAIAELADPANRLRVRHPSGFLGPAFRVRGLTVWGFTGGLLDRTLALSGWEQPWDHSRVEPLA